MAKLRALLVGATMVFVPYEFQTRLFRTIPGLAQAEFARLSAGEKFRHPPMLTAPRRP